MAGLAELFEQTLLDPELRERLEVDPASVLAGFDLSEAERSALHERGAQVLSLLGQVIEAPSSQGEPVVVASSSEDTTRELAPVSFGLALVPLALSEGDPPAVQWSVTLLAHAQAPVPEGALRLQIDLAASECDGRISVQARAHQGTAGAPPPARTWQLQTTGEQVERARDAVLESAPGERLPALLDLLDAMGAP